ncbi:MAG: hypothetical protein Q8M92_02045, partial [Candidatus Subteraquimicrobiales bacterium]|nr:hypothetical protein [Candidatus Subteraquimicrobiales bacterium]
SSNACYSDSINLLEYGFKNFKNKKIISKGKMYKKVDVPVWENELELIAAKNLDILFNQDKGEPELVIEAFALKALPVQKGEKIGEIIVVQGDSELGRVDLVAKEGVSKPTIWQRIILFFKKILT